MEETIIKAKTTKPAKEKVSKEKAAASDDLTQIEGISKKVAELLAAEKINTFSQLSKSSVKKLKSVLDAAGNKFSDIDPAAWPKLAKAAASAKSSK